MPNGLPTLPVPISKEHSHLICPVCHQFFRNPKYLPCHHSYCEECLEKTQEHSKVTCSKCRNEVTVPLGGVKNLPNNYFICHLVNKLILSYKLENEKELRCEKCDEDDPVVVYCTECKLFLCCYCKESHKYSKSHHNHNLISLTELRSNKDLLESKSGFPACSEHDLELEYYCESCEKLVCVHCTEDHENHNYDIVKKVANKYQDKLKEMTASVEKMIENLNKISDSIKNIRIDLRQQCDKASKEIDLYYDRVIEKLLQQKEQVKEQVRCTISYKEKAITRQLEEVTGSQEEILNVKRIRDAMEEGSGQELLCAKDQLVYSFKRLAKTYEKLSTKPVESTSVTVTPINEPLPQILKHLITTDSPSFEVKKLNNSVKQGETTMFKISTQNSIKDHYPTESCEATDVARETRKTQRNATKLVDKECSVKPRKVITSHNDSFGQLSGIACSSDGTWAVADWNKNCVHVFDRQYKLIRKIGGRGDKNGQFKYPCGVTFDNNNELHVSDKNNHRVQKFDICGSYMLQYGGRGDKDGQLINPIGITTHQDQVYVADRDNGRISVFQNNGKFHGIIGKCLLSHTFDIAVNTNSEILVADWGHHCIHVFLLDGHYVGKIIPHVQTGRLELKDPCSVTTDSNGYILVADTSMHNHCIYIFDKIGNCISCFGSKGSDDGQFKFPRGVAIGANDHIYVSDAGNNRVQIFPSFI